jgi:hypothetical protein
VLFERSFCVLLALASESVSGSNNLIAGGNSNNAASDNAAPGVRNANNALTNANSNHGVRVVILGTVLPTSGSLGEIPMLFQG